MADTTPPPIAFAFAVGFSGSKGGEVTRFREVSGLGSEIETAPVAEGGDNRFVHQLPKSIGHRTLTLKRGMARNDSPLLVWARDALEGGLAQPVALRDVEIALVDTAGAVLRNWTLSDALPQSWAIDPFMGNKQGVAIERAIEKLVLTYRLMARTA